jgi:hypothetical protein
LATGGATAMGASSNPRFVGLDYRPNANPGIGGGMLGGARGGPQATALNLAGLFGGGGGAPGAPGRVAGPMAQGGGMGDFLPKSIGGDNWDIDADGNVVPNYGPLGKTKTPKSAADPSVARARILRPDLYG